MRSWLSDSRIAGVTVAVVLLLAAMLGAAQAPAYRAPRTADGRPSLNGIWQALNTANWDLQGHAAAKGPAPLLGAVFTVPPGLGVVDGDEIPYLPAAAARKRENQANWVALDPEAKCYLPGVPRATYLPYPFQIVQSQQNVVISYEFANAVRVINMGAPTKAPGDSWMGWSNGRWEGETLVVDVTSLNDQTWFDRAGNFHSEALPDRALYTPQRRHAHLRSHDRGPEGILASLEDQHAPLSSGRGKCQAPGIPVRGVRRGIVVRLSSQEVD